MVATDAVVKFWEFVEVEEERSARLVGGVSATKGSQANCGDEHTAEQGCAVFAYAPAGQVDPQDPAIIHQASDAERLQALSK